MKSTIITILKKRHLYKRKLKHLFWILNGSRFVNNTDSNVVPLAFEWIRFSCPVVNHPSQSALLLSKVFNMQLACEKFNGITIKPNEIFSFWRIIGNPTQENGFLSGPTFENGKIITSYGGGLCQISGLLFNLALCSGLKILERHPHSIDAYGENRYLPLARDATVAWISKDLCFQNNTNSELQIVITANQEKAEGQILGREELESEIIIKHFYNDDFLIEKQLYRSAKIIRSISEKEEDFGWNYYKVH